MFRRLVSYLAYSPSALWGLARLSSSIRQETIKNTWVIWLTGFSLIIVWFSYFISTVNFPIATNYGYSDVSKLDLSIEQVKATTEPIKPSQPIELKLKAKNHTSSTIDVILTTDTSDVSRILSFLPSDSVVVENTSLAWSPGEIAPGQSTEISLHAQSLNAIKQFDGQPCSADILFGNKLELKIACPPLKQYYNKLMSINRPSSLLVLTIILVVILTSKCYRQLENYSKVTEIRALRDYINRGGSL